MNLNNIKHIADYHFKLLGRNRLFWFSFLFIFIVICLFHFRNQSNLFEKNPVGLFTLPSFFPYLNAYLFNFFQIIPIVFLSISFGCRKHYPDSKEVILSRPESNSEYVWGMFLGFIAAVLMTATISLTLGAIIHLCFSSAPFNVLFYIFYLFALIAPSLIFWFGISYFVVTLTNNRGISILVLLLVFILFNNYSGTFRQGLFDPLGNLLPGAFSEITGHADIGAFLLQRVFWLLMGVGFIQLTILFMRRLPNHPVKRKYLIITSSSIIIIALSLISFSYLKLRGKDMLRQTYASVYMKYTTHPRGSIIRQDINYRQKRGHMYIHSNLLICNKGINELQEILLYLNPGLHITSLEEQDHSLPFEREKQLIRIPRHLSPGDSLNIKISYDGKIDENICYLDLPDRITDNPPKNRYMTCRFGKRYAFLSTDFTLLIPEALWYPVTFPPVNPASPYNISKDFTQYTLTVSNPDQKTIISQGNCTTEGNYSIFRPNTLLSGISLCIGDYETRNIEVDSIRYSLFTFKKQASLLKQFKFGNDSLLSLHIKKLHTLAESKMGNNYPYERFTLVETPITFTSYFRNNQGGSEFVQPELIFLPERGVGQWGNIPKTYDNIRRRMETILLDEKNAIRQSSFWAHQISSLRKPTIKFDNDFYYRENLYRITPLFYSSVFAFHSDRYPVLNSIINLLLQPYQKAQVPWKEHWEAIDYLSGKSLEEAISDSLLNDITRYELLSLKSKELTNYLLLEGITTGDFFSFLSQKIAENKFTTIKFEDFDNDFQHTFGFSWLKILPQWYTANRIPRYIIRDFKVESIEPSYNTRISLRVFNDSQTNGCISIYPTTLNYQSSYRNITRAKDPTRRFLIKAGEGKEIAFILEQTSGDFTLETTISGNIPTNFNMKSNADWETSDTSVYSRPLEKIDFINQEKEVITDDSDPYFEVSQPEERFSLGNLLNRKKEVDKHINHTEHSTPEDYWSTYINANAYGNIKHTATHRFAGKGETSISWNSTLPRKGIYEAFVYIPKPSGVVLLKGIGGHRSIETEYQFYTVQTARDTREVSIKVKKGEWISLGLFECEEDENIIVLSDQGKKKQLIIGDAVKWVYTEGL